MPTIGLALIAGVLATGQPHTTEFAEHPPEHLLEGAPAVPLLNSPTARRFRSRLSEAAAEGPNFNGHYRVTHWGCGTNCIQIAILNLETGVVWIDDEETGSCWSPEVTPSAVGEDWYEVHPDSSLIYVYDCDPPSRDKIVNRRTVLVWSDGAPRLLRAERLED